jgi:methylaspartate mutase epsilon subunit
MNDNFYKERKIITNSCYGDKFDFKEVERYIASSPKELFASFQYKNAKTPLIQPRGGFPTFDKQQDLYDSLNKAEADIFPLTIDSNTRLNDYQKALSMLKISEKTGRDLLNGYPLISHGYQTTRKLIERHNKPISLRHGTPDARLLVEIALAAGVYEIEGGPISYVLPYSKDFPMDKSFLYWKYIDRLCARYSGLNKEISRESFGALTATMIPPVMTIVVQILEMLLSLEEGVKSFSVSFSQSGSITQDIVLSNVLKKASSKFAHSFGFKGVSISLVYHQWMGAFPYNKKNSVALINTSSMIGLMIGADKIITKTQDEAFGIPTKESNSESVHQAKYIVDTLVGIPSISNIEEELILEEEVNEIMDAVLNDKASTLWRKVFNSIKKGYIDIPFSPHVINNNKLVTLRDKNNNIRIYNKGNLPISAKLEKFEKKQLNKDSKVKIVDLIMKDINIML